PLADPPLFRLKLYLNDSSEPLTECSAYPERLLEHAFREKLSEALDGVWIDFESDMGELVSVVLQELAAIKTAEGEVMHRLLAARGARARLESPTTWRREAGARLRRMAKSAKGAPSPDLTASLKLDFDMLRLALGRTWNPDDTDTSLKEVLSALK